MSSIVSTSTAEAALDQMLERAVARALGLGPPVPLRRPLRRPPPSRARRNRRETQLG